eukprot:3177562-Amphidinium_carterae.1
MRRGVVVQGTAAAESVVGGQPAKKPNEKPKEPPVACSMCTEPRVAKSKFCLVHKRVSDCLYREADKKRKKNGPADADWMAYERIVAEESLFKKAISDFLERFLRG